MVFSCLRYDFVSFDVCQNVIAVYKYYMIVLVAVLHLFTNELPTVVLGAQAHVSYLGKLIQK